MAPTSAGWWFGCLRMAAAPLRASPCLPIPNTPIAVRSFDLRLVATGSAHLGHYVGSLGRNLVSDARPQPRPYRLPGIPGPERTMPLDPDRTRRNSGGGGPTIWPPASILPARPWRSCRPCRRWPSLACSLNFGTVARLERNPTTFKDESPRAAARREILFSTIRPATASPGCGPHRLQVLTAAFFGEGQAPFIEQTKSWPPADSPSACRSRAVAAGSVAIPTLGRPPCSSTAGPR